MKSIITLSILMLILTGCNNNNNNNKPIEDNNKHIEDNTRFIMTDTSYVLGGSNKPSTFKDMEFRVFKDTQTDQEYIIYRYYNTSGMCPLLSK